MCQSRKKKCFYTERKRERYQTVRNFPKDFGVFRGDESQIAQCITSYRGQSCRQSMSDQNSCSCSIEQRVKVNNESVILIVPFSPFSSYYSRYVDTGTYLIQVRKEYREVLARRWPNLTKFFLVISPKLSHLPQNTSKNIFQAQKLTSTIHNHSTNNGGTHSSNYRGLLPWR